MISLFLFVAGIFLFTFLAGRLLEKIRVPWIFAALILGAVASMFSSLYTLSESDTFVFLANLGMYFLLFIIGFEINLKEFSKKRAFLVKATIFIITVSAFLGGLIFRYIFDYSWLISLIIGFSFATVGEAILIPILDEFKMVNTRLGQAILGIGILDDIVEILTLVVLVGFIGARAGHGSIGVIIGSLFVLFGLTFLFRLMSKTGKKFKFQSIGSVFLIVMFILFLFLGVGALADAAALAAFLAGISVRNFIPERRIDLIESETKAMAYGFFAPLFFFWVGISMNLFTLIQFPFLLLLVLIVSAGAKLLSTCVVSKGYLSFKESTTLGIGLSVRFSTSIIIVKILLDSGLIMNRLYSILVASSFILTLLVPIIFSKLVIKWKLNRK